MEQTLLQLSDWPACPADADRSEAREVRYQATMALARRGSKKTAERFAVLREMLDEKSLSEIFRAKSKVKDVPDTAIIGVIMSDASRSIAELHKKLKAKGEELDLSPLMPGLEAVAKHENAALRAAAEQAVLELKK